METADTPGVTLIRTRRHADERGWFAETYATHRLSGVGIDDVFVQDNEVFTTRSGTVRGLHFQIPPSGQAKLVRCLSGAIMDVVVDVRKGSPTFGEHLSVRLDGKTGDQLYVPVGFAHGYVTLSNDVQVAYKVSRPYAPDREGGIRWDDPALGIDWALSGGDAIVSRRDGLLPALSEIVDHFDYDGRPLELIALDS